MPDRIEAGTLLCMVAATGGKITLNHISPEHISPVLNKLRECGCKIDEQRDTVYLEAPKKLKSVDIKNNAISRISNRYAICIFKYVSNCKRVINDY